MKIGILSRNPRLYSTRRLVEAARRRGLAPRVIDPIRCYMNISAEAPAMRYKGRALGRLDAVIPRVGATFTFYSAAVVRQFEAMGVYALNGSEAILRSRDKLWSLQILAARGLGMPVTGFASSPDDTRDLVRMAGGPPLILKLLAGTQGRGVVLAETGQAAESVIDAFRSLDENILIQEYIREAEGADIRCFVIGGRVAAAMRRKAAEGDFRSNLHQGGTGEPVETSPEECALAVAATRALGLGLSGVDILRSRRGPLVIEVNSSPGLEGIEAVTGLDLAGQILDHVQQEASQVQPAAR